MNKDSELNFYVTGCKSLGIACCVTHLYVPLLWELEAAILTKQQELTSTEYQETLKLENEFNR